MVTNVYYMYYTVVGGRDAKEKVHPINCLLPPPEYPNIIYQETFLVKNTPMTA